MQKLGAFLVVMGLGSFILPMLGYQFELMSMFGDKQTLAGIGAIILGVLMFLFGGGLASES